MEWLEDKVSPSVSLLKDHSMLLRDKVTQTKDLVETQAAHSAFFSRILSSLRNGASSESLRAEEGELHRREATEALRSDIL